MSTPNLEEFDRFDRDQEHERELDELRRLLANKERALARSKAKIEDLMQAAHDGAREAMVIVGTPPAVPKPSADRRKGRPEVALLHLSDWQLGKVTSSYSTEVALARVDELGEKLVELTAIERAAHPVRECHIMLGGDLPEGANIFPGQVHEIDSGVFEQAANCIGAVERTVRLALATFETVHVWVVAGNHGRIGKRGEHPREDNTDRFIAAQAYERLRGEERLTWHAPDGFYAIVEIGNYRALLIHGDQIKSFGGNLPAFGIARKVNAWASGVVPPFHDCYLGHFHQPMVLPMPEGNRRTFMNPSIESDSAYAQEFVAAIGQPGQRLNFIDPDKGRVTTERIVWLS